MEKVNEISNRTLTIKKTFNAKVKLVWEAWTNPEQILKWWAPTGMKMKVVEHNFEVGGKWKYTMPMPDGTVFSSEGVYLEIIELQKMITSADFKPMTEGVQLHMLFESEGNKTNFTFNVIHPTEEYCKQQEKMGFYNGWGSAFKRLENLLTTQLDPR